MTLIHPDDLRADAHRMREQAKQLRQIAADLDRAAAARDLAAERRQLQLARQPAEPLPACPEPARGVTRGCPHSLAGHHCLYETGLHDGLHECTCGWQWEISL